MFVYRGDTCVVYRTVAHDSVIVDWLTHRACSVHDTKCLSPVGYHLACPAQIITFRGYIQGASAHRCKCVTHDHCVVMRTDMSYVSLMSGCFRGKLTLSGGSHEGMSSGRRRGLLMDGFHADMFFRVNNPKVWEIRNTSAVGNITQGDEIDIIECSTGDHALNREGELKAVYKVRGVATYDGLQELTRETFTQNVSKHHVTLRSLDKDPRTKSSKLFAIKVKDAREHTDPIRITNRKGLFKLWYLWDDTDRTVGVQSKDYLRNMLLKPLSSMLAAEAQPGPTPASVPVEHSAPSSGALLDDKVPETDAGLLSSAGGPAKGSGDPGSSGGKLQAATQATDGDEFAGDDDATGESVGRLAADIDVEQWQAEPAVKRVEQAIMVAAAYVSSDPSLAPPEAQRMREADIDDIESEQAGRPDGLEAQAKAHASSRSRSPRRSSRPQAHVAADADSKVQGMDISRQCAGHGDGPGDGHAARRATRGDRKRVKSLGQAFAWCDDLLDELEDAATSKGLSPETCIAELISKFQATSISTAYSGIGAPETALCQFHAALEGRVAEPIQNAKVLHCIEWFSESQKELKLHPAHSEDTCIFGDIADFFQVALQPTVRRLLAQPAHTLSILGPAVRSGQAAKRKAFCQKHKRECEARRISTHASVCKMFALCCTCNLVAWVAACAMWHGWHELGAECFIH